jgi:hypothetical protein
LRSIAQRSSSATVNKGDERNAPGKLRIVAISDGVILEQERDDVRVDNDAVHAAGSIQRMASPFVERLQKLLDGLILRPELAAQYV